MLLRKVAVENVRSFLDRAELVLDGPISILIGPNGGGKTNLLDTIVVMLRRYLLASRYPHHAPTPENQDRYEFRHNDVLNNMLLEKHTEGRDRPQIVEVEVQITERDVDNMRKMQRDAQELDKQAAKKYTNLQLRQTSQSWKLDGLHVGQRLKYTLRDGSLQAHVDEPSKTFFEYLQLFEIDTKLRDEFELAPLTTPMVYLPVNRSANGFQSSIQLANFNEFEQKRQTDAVLSNSNSPIIALAIGRLAQKYRLLLEKDQGTAAKEFHEDANLLELTKLLLGLGYEWNLVSTNPLKNQYDIQLKKQGSSFFVGRASSGEREILTYLFAIFALNVRNALIVVDEPELHLHPKWQTVLLRMFKTLATATGNQFLLATHAPAFVSPESIQYVSRVFSDEQKSRIVRLNTPDLPDARHLFNIVNSQNNERIFFADRVVLVEGLSDRIFFEAVIARRPASPPKVTELVDVGGKGFFAAYSQLLKACGVPFSIIADLDYVEEIGTPEVKSLLELDAKEIKKDVVENVKSMDGQALAARIDEAMATGKWDDASDIWHYIKTRHRMLSANLSRPQRDILDAFIQDKRAEEIYLLRKGALEDYLPEGHRSKDLNKLIEFLSDKNFWDRLPEDARNELDELIALVVRED